MSSEKTYVREEECGPNQVLLHTLLGVEFLGKGVLNLLFERHVLLCFEFAAQGSSLLGVLLLHQRSRYTL